MIDLIEEMMVDLITEEMIDLIEEMMEDLIIEEMIDLIEEMTVVDLLEEDIMIIHPEKKLIMCKSKQKNMIIMKLKH